MQPFKGMDAKVGAQKRRGGCHNRDDDFSRDYFLF
jgi:hypothetical protein